MKLTGIDDLLRGFDKIDNAMGSVITSQSMTLSRNVERMIAEREAFRELIMGFVKKNL